eukprot:CAMPEP_0171562270 /NCGR_PEP_ID=MMETSP0960-20121227/14884_1 /TAXON_ID=87120 /ORGANISM="Aurantiochytrium limacinum, Strain ATCCMYA-1381" /LENGTH=106 /DNA_ID=CAMNT_0012115013 /DNA_START=636 /DNA_END=956 /DNA_ORIENTATION=+
MRHIESNHGGDRQQQHSQMHELSFYYMSFLRDRAARQGPQRNANASPAEAQRQFAMAQHAELTQRVQQLRTQLPFMTPPDRILAEQQLQYMMQQEQELRFQISQCP